MPDSLVSAGGFRSNTAVGHFSTAVFLFVHLKELIIWSISLLTKSCMGLMESALGVAEKYKAPRMKFFIVSLRKNCLAVATLPPNLK